MDRYSAGRVLGPLAPYAAGFAGELVGRGYRPRSVTGQLQLMAHLSRWVAERGVEPGGLTVEMAERFLEVRRAGDLSLCSWRALDPLVGCLRGLGVVPKLAASAVPRNRTQRRSYRQRYARHLSAPYAID